LLLKKIFQKKPPTLVYAVRTYEANLQRAFAARARILRLEGGGENEEELQQQDAAGQGQEGIPVEDHHQQQVVVDRRLQDLGELDGKGDLQQLSPPLSPDPEKSPIAAGILAGAKSISASKGFERAILYSKITLTKNF
jgi:hypothetical protein